MWSLNSKLSMVKKVKVNKFKGAYMGVFKVIHIQWSKEGMRCTAICSTHLNICSVTDWSASQMSVTMRLILSQFWDNYFAVLSQLGQFHFSQVNVRPVILLVLIGTGDCLGELQI